MIKVDEESISKVQLDLLGELKEICEKNNLKYYLFFGTLIGAIRHKGLIPWDDDIDVIMPRDDYEKFIDYCIKHKEEIKPYNIVHYSIKKRYAIVIAKFENSEYELFSKDGFSTTIGINIDIYPLDGVGNTKEDIKKATKKFLAWKEKEKYFNHNFVQSKNKWLNRFKYCFFLIRELIFDIWISSLDRKCKKKKIDDYKYCGIPVWQPDVGSYFDKDLLGNAQAEFEGDLYPIPEGYDTILRQIYGNYMELPPAEKRAPYHIEIAYKKD